MEKRRFLLIEDDKDIITLLQTFLKSEWPSADIIINFERDSYDTVRYSDVDVIFLDINLPDFNGFDLGYQLKTMAKNENMAIIYISSNPDYHFQSEDIDQDNVVFLPKPLQKEVVVNTVKSLLK